MKVALLVVVAIACIGAVSAAEPDLAATLSKRWGHWTLERLRWKREEIVSDLSQTRAELKRVKTWGGVVCQKVKEIGAARVAAAKESVGEWTDILKIRRNQRGYHRGRQTGYDKTNVYIKNGPPGRRAATNKKAWCHAHRVSCDRWHHEKKLYYKHHFNVLRHKHGKVTVHSHARVVNAKKHLAAAVAALAVARKKRNDGNANCGKNFVTQKAKWVKRAQDLKLRYAAVNKALAHVKDIRVKREATYKPFYMTKCRYIGGKHHMYYCYLDTNNAAKAHHRFRVCHHRGPQQAQVGKLKFRCYK